VPCSCARSGCTSSQLSTTGSFFPWVARVTLRGAEGARMPAVVKGDITLEPLEVRLLGTPCQVTRTHALARQGQAGRATRPGGSLARSACVQPKPSWKQIAARGASRK